MKSLWFATWSTVLAAALLRCSFGYQIYNVEDATVCNNTIWLERGPNSAAILRLTSRPYYDDTPRLCLVTFKVSKHAWSGLLGVLESIDLRRYEDLSHHLAQSICIDYISITNPKMSSEHLHTNAQRQEQCGAWSVHPGQYLPTVGYSKAMVGHCSYASAQCEPVRELTVRVEIGRRIKDQYLWKTMRSKIHGMRHKGFTFVVTAYSFSYGVNQCADDLRSCGYESRESYHSYCVHDSLFCDGHVNCGLSPGVLRSMDERNCMDHETTSTALMVASGPWVGAGLLLVLVLTSVIYKNRTRAALASGLQQQAQQPCLQMQAPPSDFNSYEVSSNVSSTPHMAIQVRVVCNPAGQSWPAGTGGATLWKQDNPPSYEALFPHGPPQEAANIVPEVHPAQFVPAIAGSSYIKPATSSNAIPSTSVSGSSSGLTRSFSTTPNLDIHQGARSSVAEPTVTFGENSSGARMNNPNEIQRCRSSTLKLQRSQPQEPCVTFNSNRSLDRRVLLRNGAAKQHMHVAISPPIPTESPPEYEVHDSSAVSPDIYRQDSSSREEFITSPGIDHNDRFQEPSFSGDEDDNRRQFGTDVRPANIQRHGSDESLT